MGGLLVTLEEGGAPEAIGRDRVPAASSTTSISGAPGRSSPIKLGMINSAWEQHGVSLVDGLRETKAIGFDCVDIFQDPLDPGANARLETTRKTCEAISLPIISVVGVSVGLVDPNPSVRQFHLRRSKAYLDMGRTLGAKNYLLVLGEYIWQKEVIPPEEQWTWGA